ncbi:sugar transferase [Devosia sp. YIM 151766]|uniref:sugar transferase n=1 Tax=Devosia sp. YIM 151766 TaxID=3017325 RepID=UPI00255C53D6|nr:sugar transferase [Devosia sp. YIM 151766]WIY54202.1 sugar transferase [Devosia sp. YIM 151766]
MSSHEEFTTLAGHASRQTILPLAPSTGYLVIKRAYDILGALLLALLVLPLLLVIAFLIRLDGGTALYYQERLGRDGKIFRFWKLRTMVPQAEEALVRHLERDPKAKAEWDRTQKLRCDPRVTRIGRLLRKHSIDELPQLWNVLIGDMSLVGPRPIMVNQQSLYPGTLYGDLRPGITGLWQVTDRHLSAFADRARLDRIYAEQVSLRTDALIMLRTLRPLFVGTGC